MGYVIKEEAINLINAHPISQKIKGLPALLKPTIKIRAKHGSLEKVATSRFGGVPDVPTGFKWPTHEGKPLNFLAQIALEEVKALDVDKALPSHGVLSFFAAVQELDEGQEIVQVFYFDQSVQPLQHAGITPFRACSLEFSSSWQLPQSEDESKELKRFFKACERKAQSQYDKQQEIYQHLRRTDPTFAPNLNWTDLPPEIYQERIKRYNEMTPSLSADKEIEAYYQLVAQVNQDEEYNQHKLLGWPTTLQLWELNKGEKLLLQIDSVEDIQGPDWEWGDMGRLFFLIKDEDLKNLAFDKVWGVFDTA